MSAEQVSERNSAHAPTHYHTVAEAKSVADAHPPAASLCRPLTAQKRVVIQNPTKEGWLEKQSQKTAQAQHTHSENSSSSSSSSQCQLTVHSSALSPLHPRFHL